ncbi:MAG: efflux RND transporter periplasmic adaptor subunit [Planctomycetaceae bacterium]|nr:efflux RND transporter periplasmic adaptor subunit [Planctomycetaceae bacterium]
MRRVLVILVLLAAAVTLVGALNLHRQPMALGVDWRIKKRQPAKEVQVERLRRGTIIQTVTAPGTIELIDEAKIASETMGQVESVHVEKGDEVKKGDLLVKLDDEDAKARLESTEARIDRLKAAIQLAEADLKKAMEESAGYENLRQLGFSSETEMRDVATVLEKMKAQLAMSTHELTESFAVRRTSQQDLERTEIRAPIDGTVIDRDVEVGEIVIAGTTNLPGTVLMTIGDMNRMRVRADVDEGDVALIRAGQPAQIFLQAAQDDPVPGVVDLIAPKGKRIAEVVSFETLITVSRTGHSLLPEMTATVEIEVQRADDAWGVPVQAVVHRRLKELPKTPLFRDWITRQPKTPAEKGKDDLMRYVTIVFVMVDGEARARPVKTGISDQERVEILEGITPEDDVIIGPFRVLDELEEGHPVKLEEVKHKAAQPGPSPGGVAQPEPAQAEPSGAGAASSDEPSGAAAKELP